MSNNKMLIDASHPEETRVVVLRGNRIEEFDFEAADKKPLRGNIYLAKVTRVEPSLQAAFVEYGGNRHGFLAFSEIHPDYYQIPVADRLALLEDEAREQREEAAEEERRSSKRNGRRRRGGRQARRSSNNDETISLEVQADAAESTENGASADAPAPDTSGPENGDQSEFTVTAAFGAGDEWLAEDKPAVATPENAEIIPEPAISADGVATGKPHEHIGESAPEEAEPAAIAGDGTAVIADAEPQPPIAAAETKEAGTAEAGVVSEARQDNEAAVVAPGETLPVADNPAGGDQEAPVQDRSTEEAPDADEKADSDDESRDDDDEGDESDDDDDETDDSDDEEDDVEQFGDDAEEDIQPAPRRTRRQYKIQEVIKRRQIMLIQVVKEERGNKGAALTTYLSLAGRYSVLMPNTARGGGISRKITDGDDRRRMKEIAQELDVPDGMGVILRTAGASRNNQEIRRDFEYLLRLWESVREMTLHSSAPTLVYEEGSLIKRSIRDLYGKEVDEVVVSGEEGYREASDFMKMLMPGHTRHVKEWREPQPVFAKYGVEPQLDALFSPNVTLKSGGYIVINQTEALVAIDVNSGRSTREHNIEDTALRTNLEAADEIARQLRLRDLAGLIVVDFIDMEEHRNNRSVERRMKDALKNDRARIQVGRISHFGLLEMSRQRMRTGVLEGSSIVCPHCQGSGNIRSTASIALHVLRLTEDALIRNNNFNLTIKTRTEVALYILNQKRATLTELEQRFGVVLTIEADDHMTGTTYHAIERGDPAVAPVRPAAQALQFSSPVGEDADDQDDEIETIEQDDEESEASDSGRSRGRSYSRRGGRQRNRSRERDDDEVQDAEAVSTDAEAASDDTAGEEAGDDESAQKRRRRRRRRGRSGDRPSSGISAEAPQPSDDGLAFMAGTIAPGLSQDEPTAETAESAQGAATPAGEAAGSEEGDTGGDTQERPRRSRRGGFRRRKRVVAGEQADTEETTSETAESSEPASEAVASEAAASEAPSPRTGSWVKTSDRLDEPAKSYPFESPASATAPTEPAEGEAAATAASTAEPVTASTSSEPVVVEPEASGAPETAGEAETNPETTQQAAQAITGSSETTEAEEPAREPRREVEVLPEAPPPTVKKTGWWKR